MGTFLLVWVAQFLTTIGSGLTNFALGVWVYQSTGSATQFALILVFGSLPHVLLAPLAGLIADRYDRRWVLILGDTGVALTTLVLAILLMMNRLELWHIYLMCLLGSAFGTLQWPAFSAATTMLVEKKNLGRASGMVQMGNAISQIITPVLAGFLIAIIQVWGVMLVDFATYLLAMIIMLSIRIPRPEKSSEGYKAEGSFWKNLSFGWVYLKLRPGLLGLLILFSMVNISTGFFSSLFTPMVLSTHTAQTLGAIVSAGGVGLLAGSLIMSAWGGPKPGKRVTGIFIYLLLFGLGTSVLGISPAVPVIIAGLLLMEFILPIVSGASQVIWQSKVEADIQGRVFSVRTMVASFFQPLSYLVAGPLADKLFEPGMAEGGRFSDVIGGLIGSGPGRGMGLLLLITGIIVILATLVAFTNPRIRKLETEIPDAVTTEHGSPE